MQAVVIKTVIGTSTTGWCADDTVTFRGVPSVDQLTQPQCSVEDDEDECRRKSVRSDSARSKRPWEKLESRKSWFFGVTSLGTAVLFGIMIYILSRSGANAQEVNLSQVVTEARGRVGKSLSAARTGPHDGSRRAAVKNEFPEMDNAIQEIRKLGPHNDLDGLILKLEHVAKALDGSSSTFKRQLSEAIPYLNKNLEGHFRLENHLGRYESFQIWDGDVLTPYVLKHSEWPYPSSAFRTSRIERLTQNAKHVARIYHVFGLGGVKNLYSTINTRSYYYTWYLEERVTPLEITPDVDIDTVRTILRHVIMGLKELEIDTVIFSPRKYVESIGYTTATDDQGKETKVYKIATSSLHYANANTSISSHRFRMAWLLLAMNTKMEAWGDLKAKLTLRLRGDETWSFYGPIGESPECLDFLSWCIDPIQEGPQGDGITWANVLERHPFLTNGTVSPDARENGRLKTLVTFY